jgi:hypothetical protein
MVCAVRAGDRSIPQGSRPGQKGMIQHVSWHGFSGPWSCYVWNSVRQTLSSVRLLSLWLDEKVQGPEQLFVAAGPQFRRGHAFLPFGNQWGHAGSQ